jgi:hypothetical protein
MGRLKHEAFHQINTQSLLSSQTEYVMKKDIYYMCVFDYISLHFFFIRSPIFNDEKGMNFVDMIATNSIYINIYIS